MLSMLDVFIYFGPLFEGAIVIGLACVMASTAWGVVETRHRKQNVDYF